MSSSLLQQYTLEQALLSASQEIEMHADNPAAIQSVVLQRDDLQSGLLSTCRELSRATAVSTWPSLEASWHQDLVPQCRGAVTGVRACLVADCIQGQQCDLVRAFLRRGRGVAIWSVVEPGLVPRPVIQELREPGLEAALCLKKKKKSHLKWV